MLQISFDIPLLVPQGEISNVSEHVLPHFVYMLCYEQAAALVFKQLNDLQTVKWSEN